MSMITETTQKLNKPTALDYCHAVFSLNGCSNECAGKVHHLSETDIWVAHQRFAHLGNFQQRQWVLGYQHSNTSSELKETNFVISGKVACLSMWLSVLGLSRSRYYEVRKEFANGVLFLK